MSKEKDIYDACNNVMDDMDNENFQIEHRQNYAYDIIYFYFDVESMTIEGLLWCSEDDTREFNEKKDSYETYEHMIKREIKNIKRGFRKLKI